MIPKSRAERIALRDRLNELIEAENENRFVCAHEPSDVLITGRWGNFIHAEILVRGEEEGDATHEVALTPDSARRLAARLLWLVEHPEEG